MRRDLSSKPYELLIFDWDGTLADSIGRIVEAMNAAAERAGEASSPESAVKGIIGLFIGPVILGVTYVLFWQWVALQVPEQPTPPAD